MSFLANKPRAAASATPSAPAVRQAGRYTGLRSTGDQAPRIAKGNYVAEITETKTFEAFEKGRMFKVEVNILEAEPGSGNMPGPAGVVKSRANGKADKMCLPFVKRLCVVATGHEADGSFEEEYPNWEDLFDRVLGEPIVEDTFGENPLAGAKIRIRATESSKRDAAGVPYVDLAFSAYSEE